MLNRSVQEETIGMFWASEASTEYLVFNSRNQRQN